MLQLKNLCFSLLLSWTVSSTVSCKSYSEKTKAKDMEVVALDQHHFHDTIPKPVGYVNDFEHLFTAGEKHLLDSMLEGFEKRTTIQIALITIDTAMTTKDSLDAYTLRMANAWGVGQNGSHNGVTVGISKAYRKMRIQNGYGIEKILTDEETKEIIDTAFIPGFRGGDYFQGTWNGLKALMKILEQRYKP